MTCLGRSYYYVYNLGLEEARSMNFQAKPPSLHRKLWSWFQNQGSVEIEQMGILGERMLSLRHDADYQRATIPNLGGEVQMQLSRAEKFEGLIAGRHNQRRPDPKFT
jgi:hypothetical protein